MEIIDFILHVDKHLQDFIVEYDNLVYAILFLIIFVETGLVVMPFLPGDSLLFAAGMIAAQGSLNVTLLIPLLLIATFSGDNTMYFMKSTDRKRLSWRGLFQSCGPLLLSLLALEA